MFRRIVACDSKGKYPLNKGQNVQIVVISSRTANALERLVHVGGILSLE